MIDPVRLRSLVAVDRAGTVTAAATRLGYSPSAVSQQLAALARDVGVDLLAPAGRGVELTPAGRALVTAAGDVFDALERAAVAARTAQGAPSGPVRLGALGTAIVDLVPLAIRAARSSSPEVAVQVVDLGDDVLPGLRDRRVDLAVDHAWSNVAGPDLTGLTVVELCTEPVFVVAAADTDVATATARRRQAWVDFPCRLCGPAGRDILADLGVQDPDLPFTTGDVVVMHQLAALGAAAVVLPALACLHLPDEVAAWRVPGVTRRILAATRPASDGDARLRTVVAELRAAGTALEARFEDIPVDVLPGTTS